LQYLVPAYVAGADQMQLLAGPRPRQQPQDIWESSDIDATVHQDAWDAGEAISVAQRLAIAEPCGMTEVVSAAGCAGAYQFAQAKMPTSLSMCEC
jgi:hypothetical protein